VNPRRVGIADTYVMILSWEAATLNDDHTPAPSRTPLFYWVTVVGGLCPSTRPQHFFQRCRSVMLFQEIAERFIRQLLQRLCAVE
jgi:hypothetical protein